MYLSRDDLRTGAGHRIIFGFDGTSLDAELKELLREVRPLGLVLFKRNIESPEQVAELNREIKLHVNDEPLLLCVDQEGGRVARVTKPLTQFPPMRRLGEHRDPELARVLGQALADQMRALNFDVDFAPVVDVDTNPKNPIIGDRAISHDPTWVGKLAGPFIQGMQGAGIAACAKHFPGHGDTHVDSHLALPVVEHDLDRLRHIEWPPFLAAIRAGVSSVMTAHVMVPEIDPENCATLSKLCLEKHLRQELGFGGIIVSDDIEMKGLADHHDPQAIAEHGLAAGIDVFLACHKPATTLALYRALVQACEQKLRPVPELTDRHKAIKVWQRRYHQAPGASAATTLAGLAGVHERLAHKLAEMQVC